MRLLGLIARRLLVDVLQYYILQELTGFTYFVAFLFRVGRVFAQPMRLEKGDPKRMQTHDAYNFGSVVTGGCSALRPESLPSSLGRCPLPGLGKDLARESSTGCSACHTEFPPLQKGGAQCQVHAEIHKSLGQLYSFQLAAISQIQYIPFTPVQCQRFDKTWITEHRPVIVRTSEHV